MKCRDGEGSVGVARGLSERGDVGETRGNAEVVRVGKEWNQRCLCNEGSL